MDQDTRTIELIDKFIDRAERWMEDAEKREDWHDMYFYQGQKKVLEELKSTLDKTWTHGSK